VNNSRKQNGTETHRVVTASKERKAKVVDEFAAEEQRRRDYYADVQGSRERGARIARGEVPPSAALHDDDRRRANVQAYDDPPVRVVGSGSPSTGRVAGWAQIAQRAQQAIQNDLGSRAERTSVDPDTAANEPKATTLAKFGPSTPPAR
jgi:hypothetical protein